MGSLAAALLFLLVMAILYIATLSQWGIFERRIRESETRHMRIQADCERISEGHRAAAHHNGRSITEGIPGDTFDVTKN